MTNLMLFCKRCLLTPILQLFLKTDDKFGKFWILCIQLERILILLFCWFRNCIKLQPCHYINSFAGLLLVYFYKNFYTKIIFLNYSCYKALSFNLNDQGHHLWCTKYFLYTTCLLIYWYSNLFYRNWISTFV